MRASLPPLSALSLSLSLSLSVFNSHSLFTVMLDRSWVGNAFDTLLSANYILHKYI